MRDRLKDLQNVAIQKLLEHEKTLHERSRVQGGKSNAKGKGKERET